MIETKFITHEDRCVFQISDPTHLLSADLWLDARVLEQLVFHASAALETLHDWNEQQNRKYEPVAVQLTAL